MHKADSFITFARHVVLSILMLAFVVSSLSLVHFALAEDTISELQKEIAERNSQVEIINKQMEQYRERVKQFSLESANLANDVAMIENQIAVAELDVSVTQIEIETSQLELRLLEEQVREQESKLEEQRTMLSEMLFMLHRKGEVGFVEVLFGSRSFHDLFTEVEQLEGINADLSRALDITHATKEDLERSKTEQVQRLDRLVALEEELLASVAKLELQQTAKDSLLLASQQSESQYRVLMSELRQENQFITNEISAIQQRLNEQTSQSQTESASMSDGEAPGVMHWPLAGGVITAVYHDKTYPFRNLFEHSGLDIAVPTGTSVRATAPGVVAWARTGSSYGNYIMIIHDDGFATLYAHLSRMDVRPDQFVARGQQIGLSGNTGFSTGPHLHYEVRLNGIPVNPQTYLVKR